MKKPIASSLVLLLVTVSLATASDGRAERTRSNIVLRASVQASAGGPGESGNVRLNATLAQPTPVGVGSSGNVELTAGYWAARAILTEVPTQNPPGAYQNSLFQNVPNPFNPITTLLFETADGGRASITIYDITGRSVRHLVDESVAPGRYEAVWDARDDAGRSVASGLYLYRLGIGSFTDVKKMVLVR